MKIAAVIAFFAVILFLAWLQMYSETRRLARIMACRQPLSDEEFTARFYPDDKACIGVRIRGLLSQHLGADLRGLLPSERFREDLHVGIDDGLDEVEFAMSLEEEFAISIDDNEWNALSTVDELVKLVHKKL